MKKLLISPVLLVVLVVLLVFPASATSAADLGNIQYSLSAETMVYEHNEYLLSRAGIYDTYEPYFVFKSQGYVYVVWVYQIDTVLGNAFVGFDGTAYYYDDNPIYVSEYALNADNTLSFVVNRPWADYLYGNPPTDDLSEFRSRFLCSRYDILFSDGSVFYYRNPIVFVERGSDYFYVSGSDYVYVAGRHVVPPSSEFSAAGFIVSSSNTLSGYDYSYSIYFYRPSDLVMTDDVSPFRFSLQPDGQYHFSCDLMFERWDAHFSIADGEFSKWHFSGVTHHYGPYMDFDSVSTARSRFVASYLPIQWNFDDGTPSSSVFFWENPKGLALAVQTNFPYKQTSVDDAQEMEQGILGALTRPLTVFTSTVESVIDGITAFASGFAFLSFVFNGLFGLPVLSFVFFIALVLGVVLSLLGAVGSALSKPSTPPNDGQVPGQERFW